MHPGVDLVGAASDEPQAEKKSDEQVNIKGVDENSDDCHNLRLRG